MVSAVKWSEIPVAIRWGIGTGLAACAVALAAPFEIKMVFFVASLFAASLGFRDQGVKQHFRLAGFETVADESDPGPHPFTTGLAIGMIPICVVTMALAFWNWFGWKFVAAVVAVLLFAVFNEKIKEVWYSFIDRIAEKWYGSKAQAYFLEHQAGVCFFSGMAILVASVGVICTTDPISNRATLIRMLVSVVGMIFGAVVALFGIGIKSVENS